jgi:hypothetical protein
MYVNIQIIHLISLPGYKDIWKVQGLHYIIKSPYFFSDWQNNENGEQHNGTR